MITRTFMVETSSEEVMARFERLLGLLHFSSAFGHSGTFGMPLDGDGSEKFRAGPLSVDLRSEVDAITRVGYDLELAGNQSYQGWFKDRNRASRWIATKNPDPKKRGAVLYKDGIPHSARGEE